MKRLFGSLLFSMLLIAGGGQAHAQQAATTASDDEDEAYEYFYGELIATAIQNENCKSVIEPAYYEGFKVLLRVYYGGMGATNEDVNQQEADNVEFADYICQDKTACWRSATKLSATATPEEGREKCMAMLTESFKYLEESSAQLGEQSPS